jgi:hypothetical protein
MKNWFGSSSGAVAMATSHPSEDIAPKGMRRRLRGSMHEAMSERREVCLFATSLELLAVHHASSRIGGKADSMPPIRRQVPALVDVLALADDSDMVRWGMSLSLLNFSGG